MVAKFRLSSDDRKSHIIETVMPLFADKGFHCTTTKQLADAAGVSEALLYKHFPSKTELFEAMQEHLCHAKEQNSNRLAEQEPSTTTLIMIIYYIVHVILLGWGETKEHHEMCKRLMFQSIQSDGDFARQFHGAQFAPYLEAISECIDASKKSGDLVSDIPNHLLIYFSHHLAVAINLYQLPEEAIIDYELDIEEVAAHATKFLLRAIGLSDNAIENKYKPEQFLEFFIKQAN